MKACQDPDADTGAEQCTQTVMTQHIVSIMPQSTDIASHGEPGPPFRPHTDDVHLADDDLPDIDMEEVSGVHAIVSHSPGSYIISAKDMVETMDTQCLGSTQGSDQPTQQTINERSVADSDTFGECQRLGFTRGSDGITHATLQDGPEMIVDTTPGERTHVTRHEGSMVA